METKKTVLIVTDGDDSTLKIAEVVSAALGDYQVVIRQAESLAGTDLLPAHAFFLGCKTPNPPSFAYIKELLGHINLAGRPCGVFSEDSKALKYLSGLVKDSEASLGEPLLAQDGAAGSAAVQKWLRKILK